MIPVTGSIEPGIITRSPTRILASNIVSALWSPDRAIECSSNRNALLKQEYTTLALSQTYRTSNHPASSTTSKRLGSMWKTIPCFGKLTSQPSFSHAKMTPMLPSIVSRTKLPTCISLPDYPYNIALSAVTVNGFFVREMSSLADNFYFVVPRSNNMIRSTLDTPHLPYPMIIVIRRHGNKAMIWTVPLDALSSTGAVKGTN